MTADQAAELDAGPTPDQEPGPRMLARARAEEAARSAWRRRAAGDLREAQVRAEKVRWARAGGPPSAGENDTICEGCGRARPDVAPRQVMAQLCAGCTGVDAVNDVDGHDRAQPIQAESSGP